jgi:hypothetical protein
VIITVVAVYVMQMAIHQKIRAFSVRDGFMSAAGAATMSLVMTSTSVLRSTVLRILRADLDDVLVNMIAQRGRPLPRPLCRCHRPGAVSPSEGGRSSTATRCLNAVDGIVHGHGNHGSIESACLRCADVFCAHRFHGALHPSRHYLTFRGVDKIGREHANNQQAQERGIPPAEFLRCCFS